MKRFARVMTGVTVVAAAFVLAPAAEAILPPCPGTIVWSSVCVNVGPGSGGQQVEVQLTGPLVPQIPTAVVLATVGSRGAGEGAEIACSVQLCLIEDAGVQPDGAGADLCGGYPDSMTGTLASWCWVIDVAPSNGLVQPLVETDVGNGPAGITSESTAFATVLGPTPSNPTGPVSYDSSVVVLPATVDAAGQQATVVVVADGTQQGTRSTGGVRQATVTESVFGVCKTVDLRSRVVVNC